VDEKWFAKVQVKVTISRVENIPSAAKEVIAPPPPPAPLIARDDNDDLPVFEL
jgi:hypothetical protein